MNKLPTIIFINVITISIMAYVMVYAYYPNLFQNLMPLTISINIFISAILAYSIYLIEHNKEKKRKIMGCGSIAIKLFYLCENLKEVIKSEDDEEGNYFKIHVSMKQIEYTTLIFSDILPNDDIESLLHPISFWLTFFENHKPLKSDPNYFDLSYYNMIYDDILHTYRKWQKYIPLDV